MGNNKISYYILTKMKAIIFAMLIAYCASQQVLSPSQLCWNNTCKNDWQNYVQPANGVRRAQSVVAFKTVSTEDCNNECYDDCVCSHQAIGSRRLQGVVNWRQPNCTKKCFDTCYTTTLKTKLQQTPKRNRRLQVMATPEQQSADQCAAECKMTRTEVTAPVPKDVCQTECVCKA